MMKFFGLNASPLTRYEFWFLIEMRNEKCNNIFKRAFKIENAIYVDSEFIFIRILNIQRNP